ncbi:MAG: bifunctional ornithine acetyltransferase/N-acetylglutamate synthase, partial [Planctomycetota bacterium]
MTNNTITSPRGFLAAGVRCGIKKSGQADLALLVCPAGAKAAAVFTTNKIVAAPVMVNKAYIIRSRKIYAIVVNSGNANACTGYRGVLNALKMCSRTAQQIGTDAWRVFVASTGIIGEQLPINKIIAGISKAAAKLSASSKAGLDFTKAIMTTDTKPKQAVRRIEISGKKVTIAGAVKGAGMIAPNMATTLCFITTDAA